MEKISESNFAGKSVSGVVNVLKPPGMSSHDVIAFLRRIYGTRRIGHAGTLDPAAAGVLPVFVGNAARFIEYFPESKEYFAEILFGVETDTLDDTGNIVAAIKDAEIDENTLNVILNSFCGEISQIPPLCSAIKVNGRKLYEYARRGDQIEIKPRSVSIHAIELLEFKKSFARIRVCCSGGTYIRSLCRDIGIKSGSVATMGFLLRARSGVFELFNSLALEEIQENPVESLTAVNEYLEKIYPQLFLNVQQAQDFQNGKKIILKSVEEYDNAIVKCRNHFLGMALVKNNILIAKKVIRADVLDE